MAQRRRTPRSPPRQRMSLTFRPLLQRRNGWKLLALDELEESAAARRDVGNPILDVVFLDRRQRVAAACKRKGFAARDGMRYRPCPLAELLELEDADRSVPQDGTR